MQKENDIIESKNKEAYNIKEIIVNPEINELQSKKINYYEKSIYALIEYMEENEINPSEKRWNQIAIRKKYLSSKTIGYISKVGFNKLCRNLRKQINKNKRQK